jgi:hypothetical protein
MEKDVVELLSKLFTPKVTLVILLILGVIITLYNAIIKFFFDRKLKSFENDRADKLATVQAHLSAETQVLVQDLQTKSNRARKELEAELTRKTQTELQKSQAVITEAQAEQQSRRDYQYEARKRLVPRIRTPYLRAAGVLRKCWRQDSRHRAERSQGGSPGLVSNK